MDRLGQRFSEVAIVNLMYEHTVKTDVYRVLRTRIGLFTSIVGKLQPILATLPSRIASATRVASPDRERARNQLVGALASAIASSQAAGFDLDEATEAALEEPTRPAPPYGLEELHTWLLKPTLLPNGSEVSRPLSPSTRRTPG